MKKLIIGLLIAAAFILIYSTSVKNARLVSNLTVYENLVTPTTSTFIERNGLNETVNYRDGLTRNDADNVYADTVLASGTIDLTSLENSLGESLDLTGDNIVALKVKLEDDSAATCVISQGESNPYKLLGDTYSLTLKANQSLLFKADTVLDVVANDAKTIDYTISNDSTILYIILVTADSFI